MNRYNMNIDLSKMSAADGDSRLRVDAFAKEAAKKVFEAGGSPRAQLDAARKASFSGRLGYRPHDGAKERAKRLARMTARAEA